MTVKEARKALGISQEEMAVFLGVSRQTAFARDDQEIDETTQDAVIRAAESKKRDAQDLLDHFAGEATVECPCQTQAGPDNVATTFALDALTGDTIGMIRWMPNQGPRVGRGVLKVIMGNEETVEEEEETDE